MSRNRIYREAADKLPVMYKVDKLGRKMYDYRGMPIHVNHLKEMLAIRDTVRRRYAGTNTAPERIQKDELQEIGRYSQDILNQHQKMRVERIRKWIVAISITVLVIYLSVKYL